MTLEFRKKLVPTLLAAAIMALILGQSHAGFMLLFVAMALLAWIPYSAYVMFRKPDIRALQLARISIWLFAVVLVAGIHYLRHETTRRNANEIVASIKLFSAAHGRCPATLDEVGISPQQLKEKLGKSGYECRDGKPFIFYAATYIVFDTYSYNFAANQWEYHD